MKGKLYVVTMYRFGDPDNHSYLLGVYSKKAKAQDEGERHKAYRGYKYYPEVLEVDTNVTLPDDGFKAVVSLKNICK